MKDKTMTMNKTRKYFEIIRADDSILHDDEKGAKMKQRKKVKEERKASKNATVTTPGVADEWDMEKVLADLGELEVVETVKGKRSKTKSNKSQKN